jgi:hypothetical protein
VEAAFSLIEIMVTIALLSFIVLGLLAMFNQTQRAFRSSMTQVDVLEAGRAVTDIIARDMEQMVAGHLAYMKNSDGSFHISTNFFAEMTPFMMQGVLQGLAGTGPGPQECRTNVFQDVFCLTKQNLDYIGIGYHIQPDPCNFVGTLYRFSTNRPKSAFGPPFDAIGLPYNATQLSWEFRNATNMPPGSSGPPGMSRIADGVVHFQVTAYDTNGMPFSFYNVSPYYGWFRTNGLAPVSASGSGYGNMQNSRVMIGNAAMRDRLNYYFFSNAVPAYVEVEVAFLEPHILDRLKGIGNLNPTAQLQYLSNHVANVHLFRRRIPIRNVDFLAYQ